MNLSQLKINDFVTVQFPETKQNAISREFAIVTAVDNDKRETRFRPINQKDEIILSWDKPDISNQVHDIPLSASLLEKLGFQLKEGALYALPTHERWFEKIYSINGFTFCFQVKLEHGEWILVIPKTEAKFMCRFESLSTIRSLQDKIRKIYDVEIPIDQFFSV